MNQYLHIMLQLVYVNDNSSDLRFLCAPKYVGIFFINLFVSFLLNKLFFSLHFSFIL